MKKKLSILAIAVLAVALLLTSCDFSGGDKKVTGIEIVQGTFKYEYELNEVPDFSGVEAKVKYNDDTEKSVTGADLTFSTIDTSKPGIKTLSISYEGYTLELDVRVLAGTIGGGDTDKATVTGIEATVAQDKATVFKGTEFNTSFIRVTAVYSDSTTALVPAEELTFGTIDTSTAGKKTVTVTYGDFSANVEIEVIDVKSIVVDTDTVKSELLVGQKLDVSRIEVLVTYTNGKSETVYANSLTVQNIDASTAGDKSLVIAYRGAATVFNVKVYGITGIEVDADSINTTLPAGNVPNLDDIIVKLVYENGYKVDVDRSEITTNVGELDWNAEGEKTLVVTYGDYTADVIVSSDEPTLVSIELSAYAAKIGLGQAYNKNAVTVTAKYSNKTTKTITSNELTVGDVDTATVGTKELSVTYGGLTATKTVEVLAISTVALKNVPEKINVGDVLNTGAISMLVTFSDGSAVTVGSDALVFGDFSTETYGDRELTVSYMGSFATAKIHVKGVKGITVVAGTLTNALYTTDTFTTAGTLIDVTYSDGSVLEGVSDAIFGEIDTTTEGDKQLSITYDGYTVYVTVTVKKIVAGSTIFGVSLPSNITSIESNKGLYRNKNKGYYVGDDNAYILTLNLVVLDENDNKVSTAINYTSYSLVYLVDGANETLLEGAELAKYVSIDETKNAFDFTEEAIGKTFKIATRPASNFLPGQESIMTRTHTVNVVDGYNIYNAKELNILTNKDSTFGENGQYNQMEEVNNFLALHNIVRPEKLAGVVLHGDLIIKESDIPDSYVAEYTNAAGVKKKGLYDQLSVYRHAVTKDVPHFSIYGNYYSISSYSIPNVGEQNYLDNSDHLSNSQLFMFTVADELIVGDGYQSYDPNNYSTNVYDLTLRDNDPNSDKQEDSARHLLGVIGVKTRLHTVNYNNSRIEAYFISFMTDSDHQVINLNQVDFYNAWQGHIFTYGSNRVWEKNDAENTAPGETYYPISINITDSRLAKCGGPVFLCQTVVIDSNGAVIPANTKSKTDIVVDDVSEIYSYVTGTEAWFNAFGQTQLAMSILAMSQHISNVSGGAANYANSTLIEGHTAMNLVLVNMANASNLVIDPTISPDQIDDIDGTLKIGDSLAMNMDDGTVQSMTVDAYARGIYAAMKQIPPIFQTSAGGTCASDGQSMVFGLNPQTGAMAAPDVSCFQGDYITLYYLGVAVTLEYFQAGQ